MLKNILAVIIFIFSNYVLDELPEDVLVRSDSSKDSLEENT